MTSRPSHRLSEDPTIMEAGDILAAMPARLSHLVRGWAEAAPDNVALHTDQRAISYGELWQATERLAWTLADAGVRAGDRVQIVCENGPAAIALMLACSELDAWACPINARMKPAEIEGARELIQARVAVFTLDDSPDATAHAKDRPGRRHEDETCGAIFISAADQNVSPEPVKQDKAEQIGVLLSTSGSTGAPKAVMLSHQAVMYQGATMAIYRGIGQDACFYLVPPVSHTIGIGAILMAVLWAGASAQVVARFTPEHLVRCVREGRLSHMMGVSTIYQRAMDHAAANGLDLKSDRMRMIGTGGSPLDPEVKRQIETAFGVRVSNSYGLTECNPVARTQFGVENDSIGNVQPGVEVRIVAPDGSDAAPGEVGSFWVRGPNAMLGYYRNPQGTAEVMKGEGWIDTGDLARRDENGDYFIAGRTKELIIRSGFNVYPAEVETVLSQHDAVAACAVVGRPEQGNEEVIAFVQLREGASADADALKAHVRASLAAYKCPGRIVFLDDMPVGLSGKILKKELKERARLMA